MGGKVPTSINPVKYRIFIGQPPYSYQQMLGSMYYPFWAFPVSSGLFEARFGYDDDEKLIMVSVAEAKAFRHCAIAPMPCFKHPAVPVILAEAGRIDASNGQTSQVSK